MNNVNVGEPFCLQHPKQDIWTTHKDTFLRKLVEGGDDSVTCFLPQSVQALMSPFYQGGCVNSGEEVISNMHPQIFTA